jgi:hypothetical protein
VTSPATVGAVQAARIDFELTPESGNNHRGEVNRRAEQFFRVDVLGMPGDIPGAFSLGIGKPNPSSMRCTGRIKANPARRLRIVTALSLERRSARATWSSTSWRRWSSGCSATTPTWTT